MQILLNLSLISVLLIGCQQRVQSNTNQNLSDILKNSPRIEGKTRIFTITVLDYRKQGLYGWPSRWNVSGLGLAH